MLGRLLSRATLSSAAASSENLAQNLYNDALTVCALRLVHTSPATCEPAVPSVAQAAADFANAAKKATVTINGHSLEVPEGTSILQAASQLGIYIPTLCTHPRLPTTPGTCRLCLVEEGGRLKPACATPVTDGMHVETDTAQVKDSVRGVLALLKANHPMECMTCEVNGRCEFQDLIRRYNVTDQLPRLRHFSHEWDDEVQSDFEALHDTSSAAIQVDLEKCLKCGRCVTACGMIQNMDVLGWEGRGRGRHPSVITPELLDSSKCIECGQCASVCPVGAITERSEWRAVLDELDNKRKLMVCMTAPAVRVAIGEEVGMAPGSITVGQMAAAQRALGFDKVLDVDFAADLTIMEEGTELLQRLQHAWGLDNDAQAGDEHGHEHAPGPLPMFTSCCPAWINLVEKSFPELIPNLSTCKSPQQMMGAVVKRFYASKLGVAPDEICLVSFMPCTAKKHEAERKEQRRPGEGLDVDFVLTTREFGHMLRMKRIPLASLPEEPFDSPLGASTGAAVMFGATGGVMEAALRTAYEVASGQPLPKLEVDAIRGLAGVKEATVTLPEASPPGIAGRQIRVAVASGVGNARHLLQRMAEGSAPQYDFIEVMACPGGCVGGGGQPKSRDPQAVLKRMGAIYTLDQRSSLRKSHENPEVTALYDEFLRAPGGELSHELLHTRYTDHSHTTVPQYSVLERAADVAAHEAQGHDAQRQTSSQAPQ